ncbi:hypothetical protein BGW38_000470 [Lunasporangiospora selenospora]|uniref:Serine aminopeptidase S33 domain-containing protein n=1 Tax=Lunasporangiospora selenospora TaxID=979761 RepID=A0A9P6KES9_9FUNG|nr:hypothetical protein BGW38_000470 [Lunasporangiospora selenospora]
MATDNSTTRPTPKEEWIKAEDGYDHVFEEFNKAGFQVHAFDQRGFGQTGKKSKTLGRSGGYAKAIPDITEALKRSEIEGVPLFLMGHSYGGSLVLNYNCIGPLRSKLSGVIASAPLVLASAPTRPNNLTISFAGVVSKVMPSLRIPVNLSSKFISRDKDEVAKYNKDPLVHGYGTTKGLFDMLTNGKLLLTERFKAASAEVPLLICHGTDDGLTDPKASKSFFDKCTHIKDKEYKLFEGHYHELHNEPEVDRKAVIDHYIQWLKAHLPKKQPKEDPKEVAKEQPKEDSKEEPKEQPITNPTPEAAEASDVIKVADAAAAPVPAQA